MQAKLLRVLEQKEVERIGGDRPIPVDVRVIVATHRNLDELVAQRRVSPGPVPSHLRFSHHCCRRCASAARTSGCWWIFSRRPWPSRTIGSRAKLRAEAYAELQRYTWPGNVRELRNVVRAPAAAGRRQSGSATVRLALAVHRANPASSGTLVGPHGRPNATMILTELKRHAFKMTDTARALGLERSHLYKKCQQLGIEHKNS